MRLPLSKSISFQEDTLSNENSSLQTDESAYNFVTWLWPGVDHVPESERRNAIKGISGMLKFGNHESPILLEVLGNLLCNCNYRFSENDRNMAARAYLRASYLVDDEQSRLDYQELASSVLDMQRRHPYSSQSVTLKATEHALKADILDAQQWYEQVKENELKWIAAGKNVDDEFTRMYYSEPVSIDTQGQYWKLIPWLLGLGCIFIPLCISLPVIWLIRFGNRALSKSFPNIETTSTKKTT
jgi:hypothetical protein